MSNKWWEDAYVYATVQKSMRSASDLQCQTILNTLMEETKWLCIYCSTLRVKAPEKIVKCIFYHIENDPSTWPVIFH